MLIDLKEDIYREFGTVYLFSDYRLTEIYVIFNNNCKRGDAESNDISDRLRCHV